MVYLFQSKVTIVVKEITVSSVTLGRKEITFQYQSLKDYIRIESIAGPPDKLKFIDLDPEQVGTVHYTFKRNRFVVSDCTCTVWQKNDIIIL